MARTLKWAFPLRGWDPCLQSRYGDLSPAEPTTATSLCLCCSILSCVCFVLHVTILDLWLFESLLDCTLVYNQSQIALPGCLSLMTAPACNHIETCV